MRYSRFWLTASVLTLTIGVGVLLNRMGAMAPVDWVTSGLLTVMGVLLVALAGVDRLTVVVGPTLIAAGVGTACTATGAVEQAYLTPLLLITLGATMLLSTVAPLRRPSWLLDTPTLDEHRASGPMQGRTDVV